MVQAATTTNAYEGAKKPGQVVLVSDVAVNDSDKTLTVPANRLWMVDTVYAFLATSATVGLRRIYVEVRDAAAAMITLAVSDLSQVAGTSEHYTFRRSVLYRSEPVAGNHFCPLPCRWLPAGYSLRVYDQAVIDPAADDLTLRMVVIEYDLSP